MPECGNVNMAAQFLTPIAILRQRPIQPKLPYGPIRHQTKSIAHQEPHESAHQNFFPIG